MLVQAHYLYKHIRRHHLQLLNAIIVLYFLTDLGFQIFEGYTCRHIRYRQEVNFINILRTTFFPIFWCQKITKLNVTREKLLNLLCFDEIESRITTYRQLQRFFKCLIWGQNPCFRREKRWNFWHGDAYLLLSLDVLNFLLYPYRAEALLRFLCHF